ncbi:hypothetical protein GGI21_004113, partial [Coemansia aciculifera]
DGMVGDVGAPFFPVPRPAEGWWIVVASQQTLLAVKRVAAVGTRLDTKVEFAAPETVGLNSLKMFLMCDSYLGCDQEFDLDVNVVPASMEQDEDEDEDEEN